MNFEHHESDGRGYQGGVEIDEDGDYKVETNGQIVHCIDGVKEGFTLRG